MLKKKLFLPLMMVLALTLTACATPKTQTPPVDEVKPIETPGDNTGDNTEDKTQDVEIPDDDTGVDAPANNDSMVAYGDIKLTPMDAFDKYMEKYPDTKVKKVALDTDFGSYVYKVVGYDSEKEYEIKIHPVSGDIVKEDMDNENDNKGEITESNIEKVQALVDKTIGEAGEGAMLDEWTLKAKNGKAMLEVEVDRKDKDDIEYTYNVETGELVEKDD